MSRHKVLGAGGKMNRMLNRFATLVLAALAVAVPVVAQAPQSGAAGIQRSRWWDEVEDVDSLIAGGKWRKAGRLLVPTLDRVVRESWQEPDLGRVLAALSVQHAILELHRGETEAALWHWHAALNLDPRVGERLERYGSLADPLRAHPLRRRGTLPDGSRPPPRFATPGYEPMDVGPLPPTGLFENAWVRQLGNLPPVRVEVVVGADGKLHQPILIERTTHPVVAYWTLERIRTAGLEIRPASVDGVPVDEITEVEMELKPSSRW